MVLELTKAEQAVVRDLLPTPDSCGAKTKSGAPCQSPPIFGATRCRLHGGKSPKALEAAERRILSVVDSMRRTRDTALLRLEEQIDEGLVDAKDLLAIVDKLTAKIELLEGRATERTEHAEVKYEQIRHRLEVQLDRVGERVSAGQAIIMERMGEEALPGASEGAA